MAHCMCKSDQHLMRQYTDDVIGVCVCVLYIFNLPYIQKEISMQMDNSIVIEEILSLLKYSTSTSSHSSMTLHSFQKSVSNDNTLCMLEKLCQDCMTLTYYGHLQVHAWTKHQHTKIPCMLEYSSAYHDLLPVWMHCQHIMASC